MSREQLLNQLLQNPDIWRAGQFRLSDRQPLPTGFSVLDEWIGGGWSSGVLTEILLDTPGVGELSLLMPALARLCPHLPHVSHMDSSTNDPLAERYIPGWVIFIAPPHIPYAPALVGHGFDVGRLIVVGSSYTADTLWAMEQALRSGIFAAVFGWFTQMNSHALRRLQLASEAGRCWSTIFRHAEFAGQSSPAALRICLKPDKADMQLHILRNRYGPTGALSVQC